MRKHVAKRELACKTYENMWQLDEFPLTLSQTTNSRLFQIERDDNFMFDGNGRKFSEWVENTVEKEEIARNEQFLLFPQCC